MVKIETELRKVLYFENKDFKIEKIKAFIKKTFEIWDQPIPLQV